MSPDHKPDYSRGHENDPGPLPETFLDRLDRIYGKDPGKLTTLCQDGAPVLSRGATTQQVNQWIRDARKDVVFNNETIAKYGDVDVKEDDLTSQGKRKVTAGFQSTFRTSKSRRRRG